MELNWYVNIVEQNKIKEKFMRANGLKIFYETRNDNAQEPTSAHSTDCCDDLYSAEEVTIKRFERKLVDTGIAIKLPEGFEAQIRPRSGNAWKHGLTVLNSPGTIDEEYTGNLKVILINLGEDDYTVKVGDRIAQIKYSPVYKGYYIKVDSLVKTSRGRTGFGDSGR